MRRFTRIACLIIALIMILGLVPVKQSDAASTVTYSSDALFSEFPKYLNNAETEKRLDDMITSGVDVLNAQSWGNEFTMELFKLITDGVNFHLSDIFALSNGIGGLNSTETMQRDLAQALLFRQLCDGEFPTVLEEYSDTTFSTVKKVKQVISTFNLATTTIKTAKAEFKSQIDWDEFYDLYGWSEADTMAVFDEVNKRSEGNVIKAAGYAFDAWKLATTAMQLYFIEISTIDFLYNSIGNKNSDLAIGLQLLRADKTSSPLQYVYRNYISDKMINAVAKYLSKPLESNPYIKLVLTCARVFIKNIYVGPQWDELSKAEIGLSNVRTMQVAVQDLRQTIIDRGYATDEEKANYEKLFNLYLYSIEEFLFSTVTLNTPSEVVTEQATGNAMALKEGTTISYAIHLKYATEQLNAAIAAGEESSEGELPEISGDLNAESILDRIRAVQERWEPNAGLCWADNYNHCVGSAGFARMVFNLIFGVNMPATTQYQFRYQLYGTENVNTVGMLRRADMSTDAVRALLSNAQPGDIVIGAKGMQSHCFVVIGAAATGLRVYDCDSKYTDDYTKNSIKEYAITYNDLFSAFYSDEEDEDKISDGIALYSATNRARIATNGDDIRYDDSINFIIENDVLIDYTGWQSEVRIPDGVVEIAAGVFRDCEHQQFIQKVIVPDSVTKIGASAFSNMESMYSITLGNGLTSLGNKAFYRAECLSSIILPDSLTEMGTEVFYGCISLAYAKLPDSIDTIPQSTFRGCKKLTGIDLPDSITNIEAYVFYGCTTLTDIVLPPNLKSIKALVFRSCNALDTINIPKSLETAYLAWFRNYEGYSTYETLVGPFMGSSITEFDIEDGITTIPNNLFFGCETVERITIPDSVESVGNSAFYKCTGLKSIVLPDGINSMGYEAFYRCSALESIHLPQSLTVIQEDSFYGCSALSNVTLPDGLLTIEGGAFRYCNSLRTIAIPSSLQSATCHEENVSNQASDRGPFSNCPNLSTIVFSTSSAVIPDNLFSGCDGIINIVIPSSITRIGKNAFRNCINLSAVNIENPDAEIGASAFSGCSSLQSCALPQNIKELDYGIFTNCRSLGSISIPNTVEVIRDSFYGCSSLASIALPENLRVLGHFAFSGCTSLASVELPANLEHLGYSSFADCIALTSITIPPRITNQAEEMNGGPFDGCTNLSNFSFADGIETIPQYLFAECDGLRSITIPDTVTTIENNAFEDCTNLTEINLSSGLTTIGERAFRRCSSLPSISLPDSMSSIDGYRFAGCGSLKKVTIPPSILSIDDYAFYGMTDFTIYGYTGSYAQTYATNNNIPFVPLDVPITSIAFTSEQISIPVIGDSWPIYLSIEPTDGDEWIIFSSTDETIAKVVNNEIVAVGDGVAVITATTNSGLSAQCTVYVGTAKIPVAAPSVTLNQSASVSVEKSGASKEITLSVSDVADGYNDITWTLSIDQDDDGIITLPEVTSGIIENGSALSIGSVAIAANADGEQAKTAKVLISFAGNANNEYLALPSSIRIQFNLAAGTPPDPQNASTSFTAESLTGISDAMEYCITTDAVYTSGTFQPIPDGETALAISDSIPAAGAPPKYLHLRMKAVGGGEAGAIASVEIPPRPATPEIAIDYINERTAQKLPETILYGTDADTPNAGEGEYLPLTPGVTMHFRTAATRSSFQSAIRPLALPARPAAPEGVTKTNESVRGAGDGALSGVDDTMEYRAGDTGDWTPVADDATAVTGLSAGTYQVRRMAVANTAFSSEIAELNIAPGEVYIVTFAPNGGTDIAPIDDAANNTKITAPQAPTRTGYTFDKWYKSSDLATPWDFNSDTVTNDIMLYAGWIANTDTRYTVNYHLQNATGSGYTLSETKQAQGTTDATLTLQSLAETITGFVYAEGRVGGSTVETAKVLADGSLLVDLYYNRCTYTVSFEMNGHGAAPGSFPNSVKV